jgi:hypothetical protein
MTMPPPAGASFFDVVDKDVDALVTPVRSGTDFAVRHGTQEPVANSGEARRTKANRGETRRTEEKRGENPAEKPPLVHGSRPCSLQDQ